MCARSTLSSERAPQAATRPCGWTRRVCGAPKMCARAAAAAGTLATCGLGARPRDGGGGSELSGVERLARVLVEPIEELLELLRGGVGAARGGWRRCGGCGG
eukprot:6476058-Prymnesium_polylepis.1